MSKAYPRGSDAHQRFIEGKALMTSRAWRRAALAFLGSIRAQRDVRNSWDGLVQALFHQRRFGLEAMIRRLMVETFGTAGPAAAADLQRLATLAFRLGDVATAIGWMRLAYAGDPSNARWARELIWLVQRGDPTIDGDALAALLNALRPMTDDEAAMVALRSRSLRTSNREVQDALLSAPGVLPRRPRRPRVAVLVSGQLRDPEVRLPVLRVNLAAPLQADVFVHSWAVAGVPRLSRLFAPDLLVALRRAGLPTEEALVERYPMVLRAQGKARPRQVDVAKAAGALRVEMDEQPESMTLSRSIGDVAFPDRWRTYSIGSLPMFYKIKMCFELMQQHERQVGLRYDTVVRVRPDLHFPDRVSTNLASDILRPGVVYINALDIGNLDDQFAIGARDAMERYCTAFDRLPDYWMERGGLPGATMALGEQLLFQHLFYEGVTVERLPWARRPSLLQRSVSLADMLKLLDDAGREPAFAVGAAELASLLRRPA